MTILHDKGTTLTLSAIEEVEKKIGIGLPPKYRNFLIANNGGFPSSDIVHIDGLDGSPTDIQMFFGIDRAVISSNIIWNIEVFADRLPEKCCPIACDSGNNLFCVIPGNSHSESIYYLNLETNPAIKHFVSKDIQDFLKKII